MRPMYSLLVVVGLVAFTCAQVIEERSSIRNPDGSTTHQARSSFSHATFSEEASGPDGVVRGRTVFRDSTGKITGNEWTSKDGQKIETKSIDGGDIGDIAGRSPLGGFGGVGSFGSGLNPGFGNTGFGAGFGSGVGGANFGNLGAGYGSFPSTGLPWANFGNFGRQFGNFGQFPQYNFAQFGLQPLNVPNYSPFLLGGLSSNPNIANGGQFGNIFPRIGLGSGFGTPGFTSGSYGSPGFVSRSSRHDVDPQTGRQTHSYSERSGYSSSSSTNH